MIDEGIDGMRIGKGKPKYSERKRAPVLLCPSQIPHGFSWD
jgi:hypothetical protein